MPDRDLYKVLQVDPDADADVITAAFRTLARKLHPDGPAAGANHAAFTELNRAYATLRDPDSRRIYDLSRPRRESVPVGPGHSEPVPHPMPSWEDRWTWRHSTPEPAATLTVDFGRYNGWTIKELAAYDRDYLRWLYRHSAGGRYRAAIAELVDDVVDRPDDTFKRRPARR